MVCLKKNDTLFRKNGNLSVISAAIFSQFKGDLQTKILYMYMYNNRAIWIYIMSTIVDKQWRILRHR